MSLNAARPTLQRSLSSSSALQQHHRTFSIAVPARYATQTSNNTLSQSQPQTPRGFLAEKGPFKFQQRAISYEEVVSRSRSNENATENIAAASELATLRKRTEEQKKTIGVLQGTISELLSAERKGEASA
ncbi:uncharacterized protein BDW70DRAFT_140791 [Aspergillus foveolatus]|uniref:uncharacterized protein n=1 Tax=Aspergillus foveolatus TaxID=210207 RepID=UPI003CCC92D8